MSHTTCSVDEIFPDYGNIFSLFAATKIRALHQGCSIFANLLIQVCFNLFLNYEFDKGFASQFSHQLLGYVISILNRFCAPPSNGEVFCHSHSTTHIKVYRAYHDISALAF